MDRGERAVDPFAGLKEAAEKYHVYDSHYERIGRVDDLLVDDADRVLYVGVKMGLFGTNSTIVPVEVLRVNDKRQLVEVMETEETIKQAPHFGNRDELTPEFEDRVRAHFGLQPLHATGARAEGRYDEPDLDRFAPDPRVDTEPGERAAEQRGAFLDDAPLDSDAARRDISRSEPYREPAPEPGRRANLDIPLDPPGGMPSSEPRRETVREPVERSVERPAAGARSGDRWDQLDSTAGGVTVHRKRG